MDCAFVFRHSWKACCWGVCQCKSMTHVSVSLCVLLSECVRTVTAVSASSTFKADEILWAAGATTVVTLALTLFALQTKVCIIATALYHKGFVGCGPVSLPTQCHPHLPPCLRAPHHDLHALSAIGPGSLIGKLEGQKRERKLVPWHPHYRFLLG